MALSVALAKFASFTDVFLSGLIIPLIPSIIESRVQPPQEHVQILTSVLVAAHGGAIVAVSPLMPLFAHRDISVWGVQAVGLVCVATSVTLFQTCSYLPFLILGRALQGLGAALVAGANASLNTKVASVDGKHSLSWVSPALVQNTAMAVAPAIGGHVYTSIGGETAVFYTAYSLVALAVLLSFIGAKSVPSSSVDDGVVSDDPETPRQAAVQSYGSMSLRGGYRRDGYESVSSSRSASLASTQRSRRSSASSAVSMPEDAPVFGIRMFTALYGYLVVGLLTTALYSVIPLYAERHFKLSPPAVGLLFISMSCPAVLIGPLTRLLTVRVPKVARFLAAFGFAVCAPGLALLGHLKQEIGPIQSALIAALTGISFGIGLAADPLLKEISRLLREMESFVLESDGSGASTTLPTVAHAWGSLIGPLLAGGIHLIWGWHSMTKTLAILCGFTALQTLIFLQGWIGNPRPLHNPILTATDEEAAPLLPGPGSQRGLLHETAATSKKVSHKEFSPDASEDLSSSVRTDEAPRRRHRRHFSIDNFSIATTAVTDIAPGQVRFQAALETPAPTGSSFRSALGNPERRFVLREAPHAPAADPLVAAGNRYVIDDTTAADPEKAKRHVVVFEEDAAPPELLERRQHHVVAINSIDGSIKLAASTENHAVHVTEEEAAPEDAERELPGSYRRYVVVILEDEDIRGGAPSDGDESL